MKYLSIFLMLLLIGCQTATENDDSTQSSTETENASTNIITGHVLDGPCLAGANVNIKPLDSITLAQKPGIYLTTTSTDYGYFEVPTEIDIEKTPYAFIKVSEAECYNEVTGGMMEFKTYYAMIDLTEGSVQNVTPQTTGVIKRIIELHTNQESTTYQDFAASKRQAETEWMTVFGITGITTSFSEMELDSQSDGNSALLAMNVIHLQGNSVGEQAELITNMGDDIRFDGILDDEGIITEIKNNSKALNLTDVANNLSARYLSLGFSITVPDFGVFIDSDGDGLLNGDDDDTPDSFAFTGVTGAELETEYVSNEVIISGLSKDGTTAIIGTIFVNDVELINPTVVNDDVIKLKITSDIRYTVQKTESITMNGVEYEYSVTVKADDRQQIIVFDSGQAVQDGDFGTANAQTWCDDQLIVNGLSGSVIPYLSIDVDLQDLITQDSINPRKVQSLWGGLVASRWNRMFDDEGTESFLTLGIIDDDYWTGTSVGMIMLTCDQWTRNGNVINVLDFGSYNRHDSAARIPGGDDAEQVTKCDQLRKILCIAY